MRTTWIAAVLALLLMLAGCSADSGGAPDTAPAGGDSGAVMDMSEEGAYAEGEMDMADDAGLVRAARAGSDAAFARLPEALLHQAWAERLFRPDTLATTDGESVRILATGRLNRDDDQTLVVLQRKAAES